MKKNLNVGVVGLGVGEQHVAGYQQLEATNVTDICDINPQVLKDVGDRNKIFGRHSDYRMITENPEIDIVSIASYDDHHVEQAISAFNHGKHVMIEKPIALNRADSERLLRAQQDSGRLITSNLILRQSPRFKELKSWIEDGYFGEIVAIEADYIHQILWKLTEGWRGKMDFYCVTYGGGIHMIDLMRWLIGQEVIEVNGMGNKLLTRDTPYKFDDIIMNSLRFENGTLGRSMSNLGPQRPQIHALNVYGTKQTFINDIPHARLYNGDQSHQETTVTTAYPGIEKFDLIPDFVSAILEDRQPAISITDIFRVMDICFACYDSLEAQKTISVTYLI